MMITIGITGGVGAGKSTVLDFLEEKYQAYVMKADEIGHLVMEPGQSCYEPVIALFGRQIIKNDKTIDRRQVSDVVFSHPELLEKLNQIIHPAVKQYIREQLAVKRQQGQKICAVETAGCEDVETMIKAIQAFYESEICQIKDGTWRI